MELTCMKEAFGHVANKEKLLSSKFQQVIDQVCHEIEQAVIKLRSELDPASHITPKPILDDLQAALNATGPLCQLDGCQKEPNITISKYQNILEKTLTLDMSKAYRYAGFDKQVTDQIIISHFYHEGLFDIADCLTAEVGEREPESECVSIRLQFVKMHQILDAIKSRNLEPALSWLTDNRDRLGESGSKLELKLHKLQFMQILRKESRVDALNYVRKHLSPFAVLYMDEIKKLMGCLLWAGRLEKSPYSELIAPNQWEKLLEEVNQVFCNFIGQSMRSPLTVVVAAGIQGLPTLLKLANVMSAKEQDWEAMEYLPVPVDLSEEFHFHPIFVCPVSRDQGSEENPPLLLPCGHVLCRDSINKLSKGNTRAFKCPYCPLETSIVHCKQLFL